MDFFTRQENARRRTWWLVLMFVVALVGIIASAYIACAAIFQYALVEQDAYGVSTPQPSLWQPEMLLSIATVICLIVLGGTTFKLAQLKQGGAKVAEMLGGKRIDPSSTQLDERRLLNVVEEMAIASGVPVPTAYVMPGQQGINAFAAGYSINDAVVGVTEGAMRGLTREELQGVIAHEFSHILNGDMRLNIRLIGVLHGLLILAIVGRILMRFAGTGRGGGKKGGGAIVVVVLGLALMIIGYFGFFFGGLIKRAVSRQREYLADASAVQFTRNPVGLAGALKKIGGMASGAAVRNNHAEEVSHMFFADGIQRLFGAGSLFSTHPPLIQRIKLLEPTFDGKFPVVTEDTLKTSVAHAESESRKDGKAKADKKPNIIMGSVMMGGAIGTDPRTIIQQVGVLEALSRDETSRMLNEIPQTLSAKAHEPLGAQAMVIALLIHNADQKSSADAWTWIPASYADSVSQCLDAMTKTKPEQRMLLLEMVFPALRSMTKEQAEKFIELLRQIIDSDKQVDMLEFAIFEIVQAGLRERLGHPVPSINITDTQDIMDECTTLLSKMAYVGSQDEASAKGAFAKGIAFLGVDAAKMNMKPANELNIQLLITTLNKLRTTSMPVRKKVLEAILACLVADQKATVEEIELFRAIAAVIEVPVPPMVAAGTMSAT